MDTEDVHDLVAELTGEIDDLEKALAPLTGKPLATTSSKLPLLDKAKLHVLATYALESVLFNSLRLNGADAKSHPVFAELNRVKEYFGKIKTAEFGPEKPTSRVDKDAAGRFIKAGLAGNDRIDRERQERNGREKPGVKRKLEDLSTGTHTRFDGAAKRIRTADENAAQPQADVQHESEEEGGRGGVGLSSSGTENKSKTKKNKPSDDAKKEEKRLRRQQAKEAAQDVGGESSQPTGKSSKPPKSSKEAFDSLLDGVSTKAVKNLQNDSGKKRKKRKGQALEDERADEMK